MSLLAAFMLVILAFWLGHSTGVSEGYTAGYLAHADQMRPLIDAGLNR